MKKEIIVQESYKDIMHMVTLKIRNLLGKAGWNIDLAADKLGMSKKKLKKKIEKIKSEEKNSLALVSALDVFVDFKLQQETNIRRLQKILKDKWTNASTKCKVIQEISDIQGKTIEYGQKLGLIERAPIKIQEIESESELLKKRDLLMQKLGNYRFERN